MEHGPRFGSKELDHRFSVFFGYRSNQHLPEYIPEHARLGDVAGMDRMHQRQPLGALETPRTNCRAMPPVPLFIP